MAKATVVLHGYKLYSDVWNDQPPLHTWINSKALKHVRNSILTSRLITVIFAAILLSAMYGIVSREQGPLAGGLAALFVLVSPAFIELSASCMLEIPALSMAAGALYILLRPSTSLRLTTLAAGVLFASSLAMKMVTLMYAPVLLFVIFIRLTAPAPGSSSGNALRGVAIVRPFLGFSLLFATATALVFVAIDLAVDRGAFLKNFQQSWSSHFGSIRSGEYGSPDDYPFQAVVLLRHWDTTGLALLGVFAVLRRLRENLRLSIPVAWLALTLFVFTIHRPWWTYYYVHLALPLAWCAAIGWQTLWNSARAQRTNAVASIIFLTAAMAWAAARVSLQIIDLRRLPQLHSELILSEIQPYKPFVQFIYADDAILSFHAGIPMPPSLCVVPFKRFWAGQITNAQLTAELEKYQPGLLLLKSDTSERPFAALVAKRYQLVFQDRRYLLYVDKGVLEAMRNAK